VTAAFHWPLRTPEGAKPIEQFRPGDPILSAPDDDPSAPVEVATVEEVFVNYTRVLTLHLAVPTARLPQPSTETSEKPPTALTIRTTGEHRFYVRGKGWLPAGELRPGDRLRSAHGPDPVVLALTDEQAETVVYNLRVAWYHTYFVGDRDWPCSVWAHNAYLTPRQVQAKLRTYADAYARRVRNNGGRTYNGLWEEVAEEVAGPGAKLTGRAQSAIRRYLREHAEYADVMPQVRNGNGKPGAADHQTTVQQLEDMARQEFPDENRYQIHKGTSIRGMKGPDGSVIEVDRQPDAWVEDVVAHQVVKVYEAARKDAAGNWVPRELRKKADYERLGIPYHFEEVRRHGSPAV
jgi:hypothetical protein